MTDATLSKYEAMRRRRIEENRQVLASLSLPIIPRASSRAQVSKPVVKLEPTRRSSRQRHRREKLQDEQDEISENKPKNPNEPPQNQSTPIIASPQLKRKQQQEWKAQEISRKKQKATERNLERFEKSKQHQLKRQAAARKQEHLMEMRKQQLEWHKQHELPPEKIAQRNADIQKLIQEELDKQARLAREQKQWELDQQILREEETLMLNELHAKIATPELVEVKKTVVEGADTVPMEAVMGEAEYELML